MFEDNLKKNILFLGPKGSYSDEAKDVFVNHFGLVNSVETPMNTIISLLHTLDESKNKNLLAVIPIENSIEGIVRETIDNVSRLEDKSIKILAEYALPISHCLISNAKYIGEVDTICSYPQGIAQCRSYIEKTFGDNIAFKTSASTANAVKELVGAPISYAAIASEKAAKIYDIPVLDKAINDEKDNKTRFILVGREETPRTGNDKTSITFSTENKPGALNKVLTILEDYGINMCYIDSRPSKKVLGEYTFYIDIDGHVKDEKIAKALFEILQHIKYFRHLGSYEKLS